SEGREEATGHGVVMVTDAVMKRLNRTVAGCTVALQGFGNVGSFAAKFLHDAGAKIVAVSDVAGGVWNPDGLDIPALLKWAAEHKGLAGFTGSDPLTNEQLLRTDVDLLIPAALGGVLTEEGAKGRRAQS